MTLTIRRLLIFASTLILLLTSTANAGPLLTYDDAVQSLTASNFTSSTETGMWFVEFYSLYCGHCKNFAPTFHDLAESSKHFEDSSNFHISRVNCIAQGDLCTRQNIEAYPSLELYRDGAWLESYTGGRSYEELEAFVRAVAADNRKWMSISGRFGG
ncbi:hypothetical protein NDA17_001053 [Ustilago hordei]|nr:hypothetical protein NDA17_001053 [Ustilago hordei]